MTQPDAAEVAAQRIDELLAELRSRPDPRAAAAADELTCCLVQLYGAGLTRIAAMLGPERVADLCADPLVESLLLVHDLHPVEVSERIRRALARARIPGELEHARIDEAGVVRVRLKAGGRACPSSRQAVVSQVEAVVREAAPEATEVVVEMPSAPAPLLQVSLRPGLDRPAVPLVPAEAGP
jgi:Fe-S cluster biogenesis protein NfuA